MTYSNNTLKQDMAKQWCMWPKGYLLKIFIKVQKQMQPKMKLNGV